MLKIMQCKSYFMLPNGEFNVNSLQAQQNLRRDTSLILHPRHRHPITAAAAMWMHNRRTGVTWLYDR